MPSRHIETRNIVFPKRQVRDGSCQHENINSRRTKSMSRTIEAIMRHMAAPSSRLTDQSNRVEKLEKEITVQKRHHIWSESRFVRTMLPFHSNIRVGYNGTEVAAGDLSPSDIVNPLRRVLRHVNIVEAEIEAIDADARTIRCLAGVRDIEIELKYDHLLLALGSETNFFNMHDVRDWAVTMKN